MRELLGIIAGITAIVILIAVPVTILVNHFSRSACIQRADALNFGHEYGIVKGCIYIKPDGTKVPADAYREILP